MGFLAAISNDGFDNSKGTLLGTQLIEDSTAIAFTNDEDVMVFSQSTFCDGSPQACLARINDPTNWSTEAGVGDQSGNNVYPDFP